MNRREFLECAAILVGGLGLKQSGLALSEEQKAYLLSAPNYSQRTPAFFTEQQRRVVAAIADAIIPKTETPGAIEAGTPLFIELMVSDWFDATEQETFMVGLSDLSMSTLQIYGKPFDQISAEERVQILESMENAVQDTSWYRPGNVRRAFDSQAPFICQIKELTIWGFFSSELGSKHVLRMNTMPMYFDGNVKLSEGDGTWVPVMF